MAQMHQAARGGIFIGKLEHGTDLLEEITSICRDKNIRLGTVKAIGAVQKARVAYYNQDRQVYEFLEFDQPMEILSLSGNISLKDGQPLVHAHITLSDSEGKTLGGHLAPGSVVFACECIIESFEGLEYSRGHDKTTGLPLWDI